MGREEEQAGHELRQAEQIYSPVLQEGHHSKDEPVEKTRLPVLSAIYLARDFVR